MGDVVTVRTKRILSNPLLARKQMCVDVIHSGRASIPKTEISKKIAQMYKTTPDLVVPYGFECKFGGGRTSGFALIYDNLNSLRKFEPAHRLLKAGLLKKVDRPGRKQRKERKNRQKKVYGVKKQFVGATKK